MRNYSVRIAFVGVFVALFSGMSQGAVLSATARDANDDNNHFLFGAAVTQVVNPTDPYAGISSKVTAVDNLAQPNDYIGTTATLLAGANTSGTATTVSFAWRNQTDLERDGRKFPSIPSKGVDQWAMAGGGSARTGVALGWDEYNNPTDVVNLTGIEGSYVLQMDYRDQDIIYDLPSQTEAGFAAMGKIYLGWLETTGIGVLADYDEWINAVAGNSTTGVDAVANFQGTFLEFTTAHTGFNLTTYLGSWGVDIGDNVVWAVLDHNSPLGVAPEPGTIALLAFGAMAALRRRRHARA